MDSELRLQMAHAWWTGTPEVQVTLEMKPKVRGDIRFGVIGADGKRYIAYEQGQSLLMLPGDWVGTQLHRWFPAIAIADWRHWAVILLAFIPINVAAVMSCFWLLRLFEFPERIAGLASLIWLLGTTVFYYALDHQHNSQVLLLTLLGYACALAYVLRGKPRFALLSGFVLGGTVLLRISSLIHGLTVSLFLVGMVVYQTRNPRKLLSAIALRAVLRAIALWIVGFIPLTLLGRILDYLRYGSFGLTGKKVEQLQLTTDPLWTGLPDLPPHYPLINPPYVGILGPLFSPAKSLFIYDPLLLLCLILGVIFWRKLSPYIQWYVLSNFFNLCLHLAAYSRFIFWHGDAAWGSRYHVTSVHLLIIPLLGVFVQSLLAAKGWQKGLMNAILAIAIAVQIASVMMPVNLEIFQSEIGMAGTRRDFRLGQRLTNITCLINPLFSDRCIERNPDKKRFVQKLNRLAFFPFAYQEEVKGNPQLQNVSTVLFWIWSLSLIAAIVTTAWFCYESF